MCMLELASLNAFYGKAQILRNVNLKVRKNEVTALLGRNGVGKSTTLKSIMGLGPARNGKIKFEGVEISKKAADEIARMGAGYVPEDRRIFATMTVKENLLVSYIRRQSSLKINLDRVFSLFPEVHKRIGARGDQLSGGEQQMLAIGRSLMNDPKVLLLDEPCEGLAPLIVRGLKRTLERLLKDGLSILLVEQSIRLSTELASNVYVMNKGSICYEGKMSALLSDSSIKMHYLGVNK